MTVDAKEEIENLKVWIAHEKDGIAHYTRRVEIAQGYLDECRANLKKYEERLAAELSQVSA